MESHGTHFPACVNWQKIIVLLLGVGMLLTVINVPAAPAAPADKIKAAYIYQLTQFASWPNNPSSTQEVFTICALGNDAIYNKLEPLNFRQEKTRLIKVRKPKTINDIVNCNILYIAESEQPRLDSIFKHIQGKPILTVSSTPNFATGGGIIGFVIIENKVRLEINRNAAQRANIKLSAKLLEVARVVGNDKSERHLP